MPDSMLEERLSNHLAGGRTELESDAYRVSYEQRPSGGVQFWLHKGQWTVCLFYVLPREAAEWASDEIESKALDWAAREVVRRAGNGS